MPRSGFSSMDLENPNQSSLLPQLVSLPWRPCPVPVPAPAPALSPWPVMGGMHGMGARGAGMLPTRTGSSLPTVEPKADKPDGL